MLNEINGIPQASVETENCTYACVSSFIKFRKKQMKEVYELSCLNS